MTTGEIIMSASGPASAAFWLVASVIWEKRVKKIVRDEIGSVIVEKLNDFKGQLNTPTGYRRSSECLLMMDPHEKELERMAKEIHEIRGLKASRAHGD